MKTTLLVFGYLDQVEKSETLVAVVDCGRPGSARDDGLISDAKMQEVVGSIVTFHDGFKLLYLDHNARPWVLEYWTSTGANGAKADAVPYRNCVLERRNPLSVERVPAF